MEKGVLIDNFTSRDIPCDILKGIYQYWQSMRGAHIMPSRADLYPEDIIALLPYICLVDVERETRRYKIRLIGTENVKAIGFDVTGDYLDNYPLMERQLKTRYDWLVRERRPYIISDNLKWSEKSFLDFCSIGLPLSHDKENVDILMFGSSYKYRDIHNSDKIQVANM